MIIGLLKKVHGELETRITTAFKAVLTHAGDSLTTLRTDGYRLAIDRIIEAEHIRGRLN